MKIELQKVILMTYPTTDVSGFLELMETKKNVLEVVQKNCANIESSNIQRMNIEKWIQQGQERAVLVISDSSQICHQMLQSNLPVLAITTLNGEQKNLKAGKEELSTENFWGIPYLIESINDIDVTYLERIYRRFRGIPWEILETERCILREITVEDVPRISEIYQSPIVKKYMEPLYKPLEREVAYTRDYIKNIYGFYEYGTWVVVEKTSGKIIGRAGLENYGQEWQKEETIDSVVLHENQNIDYEVAKGNDLEDKVELGYLIDDAYQRHGYATEVCKAILKYAKEELGFDIIWARIEPENTPSIHFCEKLGFNAAQEKPEKGMKLFYFNSTNTEKIKKV